MVFNVYTMRDKVAQSCGPLFQSVNHGVASRQVVNLMQKVAPHDRDAYELWWLGTWDDESGRFQVIKDVPEVIEVTIPRFDDIQARKFGFAPEEE